MKFNKLKLNKKIVGIINSSDLTTIKGGATIITCRVDCTTYPDFGCPGDNPNNGQTTLHFCNHSDNWQGNYC